jgi:alkylhydroperoxidase family enzyme
MSNIGQARKALTKRILEGDGRASLSERRAAFHNDSLVATVRVLVDRVARHACQITDADIAAARGAGRSEDQIFELLVCAAIGQATRQYDAALTALESVIGKG